MPNNFQIPPCRMKLWAEHEMPMHKLCVDCVVVVVVALLFYVHGKHLRSCRDGQLT